MGIKAYQEHATKQQAKKVAGQLGRAANKNQARQVLQELLDNRNKAAEEGRELTKEEKADFEAVANALVSKIAEYKQLEKLEKQQQKESEPNQPVAEAPASMISCSGGQQGGAGPCTVQ